MHTDDTKRSLSVSTNHMIKVLRREYAQAGETKSGYIVHLVCELLKCHAALATLILDHPEKTRQQGSVLVIPKEWEELYDRDYRRNWNRNAFRAQQEEAKRERITEPFERAVEVEEEVEEPDNYL